MNKNIIIAILVVIIIAGAGAFIFGHSFAKTETQIKIISDDSVQNGEQIQIELKDKQGNAISGQDLSIKFNNQKYTIPTDQNGKAYLTINGQSAGSYDISVEYAGNDKYDASSANAKITITDDEADNPATETSGTSVQSTDDTNNNSGGGSGEKNETDPHDGCRFLGQYGMWVRNSDDVIVEADDGRAVGMTFDDWYNTYGPGNPNNTM